MSKVVRYKVNVQSILACPLMQLGDGDGGGERGGGWRQEGGEEAWSTDLSHIPPSKVIFRYCCQQITSNVDQ
jgi:hypothetical protein